MSLFKNIWNRQASKKAAAKAMAEFSILVKDFADENPDFFILVADPKTEAVFTTFRGVCAPAHIVNPDGTEARIVSGMLSHKEKNHDIDRFLMLVDGSIFAISRSLYESRKRSLKGKIVDFVVGTKQPPTESAMKLTDGSTLSPVQVQNL